MNRVIECAPAAKTLATPEYNNSICNELVNFGAVAQKSALPAAANGGNCRPKYLNRKSGGFCTLCN